MKPTKSILDKSFVYRSAAQTDLAATFRRIRKQQQEREREQEQNPAVVQIKRRAK